MEPILKVGIVVFAYNRNLHLQKVLAGLQKNQEVKEIYVFQDGLKKEEHREGWEKTKEVIKGVDWCNVIYTLAPYNKGLAQSIIDGIDMVLNDNDAIIVLEDDCVPNKNFISFMYQCFEKYRDNKKVYNITGYSLPIDIKKEEYDIYFTGRTSSWGWGTWKDRWKEYSRDNDILKRIKKSKEKSIGLALWGNDLEEMFNARLAGRNDSWAVYWALKVIEMEGFCVAPYRSLVKNIGFDNTGVHCVQSDRYNVDLELDERRQYYLSDNVEFMCDVKKNFAVFFGGYTVINDKEEKENILVYGLGNFFKRNEKAINRRYYITAFIDKNKEGFYAGKEIIKVSHIKLWGYDKIVIMLADVLECQKVKKMLREEYGINSDKIVIGVDSFK